MTRLHLVTPGCTSILKAGATAIGSCFWLRGVSGCALSTWISSRTATQEERLGNVCVTGRRAGTRERSMENGCNGRNQVQPATAESGLRS